MAGRCAHTRKFVGGDAHADAGAANQDAAIDLVRANLMGHDGGNVGIVDAVGIMRAAINHFVIEPL